MLKKFNPENGRNEQFRIKGTSVVLNLAKNPAGFNQNISAVMQDESPKDIIIVINDNAQDGKDISWLWDVDFDLFGGDNINSITVSGIRCQDMRLRLKYVDIPSMLENDVETAIRKRIEDGYWNSYRMAGLIQLDPERYAKDGAGYIPFCYIVPQLRAQGLGVQLIGQAVSFYRPLGRQYLRLRCASYNTPAQHFYQRYGFYKIGEEQGSRVPLDILEKYIGYDR